MFPVDDDYRFQNLSKFYFYIDIELNFIFRFKSRLHLNDLTHLHSLIFNFYYFINYFVFIIIIIISILYFYFYLFIYSFFLSFFLFSFLSLPFSPHSSHYTYSLYPFASTRLSHPPCTPPTSLSLLNFFSLFFSTPHRLIPLGFLAHKRVLRVSNGPGWASRPEGVRPMVQLVGPQVGRAGRAWRAGLG